MDSYDSDSHIFQIITKFDRHGYTYTFPDDDQIIHYNMSDTPRQENGLYTTGYNCTYPYTFDFEGNFDTYYYVNLVGTYRWMAKYFMLVYLGGIYFLKKYMKTRPRYDLQYPLVIWNISLALISLLGGVRSLQELTQLITKFSFKFSMCFAGKAFLDNRVGGFWNWMFTLSKVPELGDTVFIVLRKQPLIFLHWYHHVTVLLYAWYSYSDYIATARWFVCMNYLVHSVMYSYYALKALKFKVSRYVAMFITTAQLAQMIMGAAVNIWAYQVKQAGNECHVSYENIKISLIMYTSYFVLFAHFFRRAYMKKPAIADQKPITNGVSNGTYHYDKSKKGSKFE